MSDDNRNPLTRVSDEQKTVQLHGHGMRGGSIIDAALDGMTNADLESLKKKAREEALRLEVKARELDTDYDAARKRIELHINAVHALNRGQKIVSDKLTTDIPTGAGNMRIESRSGGFCFVATVSYNDANHPDVLFLRQFRDDVLAKNLLGRRFIAWYWRNGPRLARFVGQSKALRMISRVAIGFLVSLIRMRQKRRKEAKLH